MKETDLYPPLRDFLTAHGYTVRSEVRGCDVVAEKGCSIIVLEMKRHLSVALLAQAVERQRAAESVYVVVPHPGSRVRTKEWKAVIRLLKRLELGLILVRQGSESGAEQAGLVEVVHHPVPFQPRKRKKEFSAIVSEFHGRSADLNSGGSSRQRLVTAYRENAVMIAAFLSVWGPSTPSRLRNAGTGQKTLSILSSNFYGWFERVSRGTYALSRRGFEEAPKFEELWRKYVALIDSVASESVT